MDYLEVLIFNHMFGAEIRLITKRVFSSLAEAREFISTYCSYERKNYNEDDYEEFDDDSDSGMKVAIMKSGNRILEIVGDTEGFEAQDFRELADQY